MKYKVGQLVRVKDDVVSDGHGDFLHTGVYFIGLIVGYQRMDTYEILCVGDRESEVFFESEIIEVLQ